MENDVKTCRCESWGQSDKPGKQEATHGQSEVIKTAEQKNLS